MGCCETGLNTNKNSNTMNKDFDCFPLDSSLTIEQNSIMSSIHSAISQQITTYQFGIKDIKIIENNNDNITVILKSNPNLNSTNVDDDIIHMKHDGNLFEKIEVFIKPIIITFDITIVNRYLPVIKTFDILKDESPPKKIFLGKRSHIILNVH